MRLHFDLMLTARLPVWLIQRSPNASSQAIHRCIGSPLYTLRANALFCALTP
jgi:hypothetical protein